MDNEQGAAETTAALVRQLTRPGVLHRDIEDGMALIGSDMHYSPVSRFQQLTEDLSGPLHAYSHS